MSEKTTFQELIESIAEETDSSKQFTRDFLKNFVDIVNDGLKDGEDISIAGFGKFKLRQVDERLGYNPQTEEKMTIPAHKKMVFKPYKDVRELVNAPYAHLEATLIEEDKDNEPEAEPKSQSSAKKIEEELFGITESPEKTEPVETSDTDDEKPSVATSEAFSLADDVQTDEEKEEDIVEYNEMDEELTEFMGSGEDQRDEKKPAGEASFSPTSPLGAAIDEERTSQEETVASSASVSRRKSRKRISSISVLAAAALFILLSTGGAWYFNVLPDISIQQTKPNMTASVTEVRPSVDNQSGNRQSQKVTAINQNTAGQSMGRAQSQQRRLKQLVITKGATLWSIADEQFGNPRLWPWIYNTNQSIENPDLIVAGQMLSVPPSDNPSKLSASDSVAVAKGYIATYQWYKNNNSSKAKNHLWVARQYHENIYNLAGVRINEADLNFANSTH